MTRKKSYEVYFDNEQDVIFLQDGRGNISTILAVSSGYQALLNNLIKGSKGVWGTSLIILTTRIYEMENILVLLRWSC